MPAGATYSNVLAGFAVITAILFIVLNLWFVPYQKRNPDSELNAALVFSVFWGIAAAVAIILTVNFIFESAKGRALAFLWCLGGAVVGWLLGMYITPYDPSERQQFEKIGTAVAGLASGYTIRSVQSWLKDAGPCNQVYFGLSVVSAALTVAIIYNVRAYGNVSLQIWVSDGDLIDPNDKTKAAVKSNGKIYFTASVTGTSGLDPSVIWTVQPESVTAKTPGTIDRLTGEFTAATVAAGQPNIKGKVVAVSVARSGLSNAIEVTVSA